MPKSFFITGTDTDVGKTVASAALLAALNNAGYSTMALKPVAAGCESTDEGLVNGDAQLLMEWASTELPYAQVNPIRFAPPIAPHIAAQEAGTPISVSRLVGLCRGALMRKVDVAVVEGAGGWRVPVNPRETLADFAREMQFPVILVVGLKLGCLNHALLTAEAVRRDGLNLVGWIANQPQPEAMSRQSENIETLQAMLPCPFLGTLPHSEDLDIASLAQCIDIRPLVANCKVG